MQSIKEIGQLPAKTWKPIREKSTGRVFVGYYPGWKHPMSHYEGRYGNGADYVGLDGIEEIDYIPVYEGDLKPDGTSRGYRSAARQMFKDSDGRIWPMSLSKSNDLLQAIADGKITSTGDGSIRMRFTLAKQGQNVCITPFMGALKKKKSS